MATHLSSRFSTELQLAELESLVCCVKKDYKSLRNYIAHLLGEYRDELVRHKSNFRARTMSDHASGEDASELIDVPKIMVHSGSVTEEELERRCVVQCALLRTNSFSGV